MMFIEKMTVRVFLGKFQYSYRTSTRARMKISTKNNEVLCLPTNPTQRMLQVIGNTLQVLEKFKYLGMVAYLPVPEGG